MAARLNNTTSVTPSVMSFAEKRALLVQIQPAPTQAARVDGPGLRDKLVSTFGCAPSSVLAFLSDVKTEFKFAEAVRKGRL